MPITTQELGHFYRAKFVLKLSKILIGMHFF